MPSNTKKSSMDTQDIETANDDEREKLIDADEEDDFFLKGPSAKKSVRFATDKIKSVQHQISEATDAMRDNVGRLLDRGDQLDALNARSDHLAATADSFRSSSTRMRRTLWWQGTKTKLVIFGVIATVGIVLIISIIIKYTS